MDEQSSIRRLKDGDMGGLEWLISQHQLKALRTAYLIARDIPVAEDIVQDAFLKVYRHINQFDESRPFEPWFMRIVVNSAVRSVQRETRHIAEGVKWEPISLEAAFASDGLSPEEQLELSELKVKIWDAMGQLSPRQRAAVVQRYFLDMTEKEMSDELGVATGTVKWILNTARKSLRTLLRSERNVR
jgi:RNA polymerase sigma-70 factor (ECF subfamily)